MQQARQRGSRVQAVLCSVDVATAKVRAALHAAFIGASQADAQAPS